MGEGGYITYIHEGGSGMVQKIPNLGGQGGSNFPNVGERGAKIPNVGGGGSNFPNVGGGGGKKTSGPWVPYLFKWNSTHAKGLIP